MNVKRIITITAFAALFTAAAYAQSSPAGPDLEGGWLRLDTEGSGSYHGIDLKFPRAELTPEAAKRLPPEMDEGLGPNTAPAGQPHAAGEAYIVRQPGQRGPVSNFAQGAGVDINSDPFFMIRTKNEIVIMREGPGAR